MPGRYQFSLPERPSRDGWFRIGSLDVTTTALMVLLGVASMFWYAIDQVSLTNVVFVNSLVKDGEAWRLATWPLANPLDSQGLWVVLTLVFFWFVGHRIEDQLGRRRFTLMIACMTVIPAAVVTLLPFSAPSSVSYGLGLLGIALLVVFAFDTPQAMWFFNIPLWIIAAVFVMIDVLTQSGQRRFGTLAVELGAIIVGCVTARQYGMLSDLTFIPRFTSGRGRPVTARAGVRPAKRSKARKGGSPVVAGPWQGSTHSAADQAELDGLLDKISANGIDSLSRAEKDRLNALSKQLRGN